MRVKAFALSAAAESSNSLYTLKSTLPSSLGVNTQMAVKSPSPSTCMRTTIVHNMHRFVLATATCMAISADHHWSLALGGVLPHTNRAAKAAQ